MNRSEQMIADYKAHLEQQKIESAEYKIQKQQRNTHKYTIISGIILFSIGLTVGILTGVIIKK